MVDSRIARRTRAVLGFVWLAALGACSEPAATVAPDRFADAKTVVVEEGPVTARVALAPIDPEVGDRLHLLIEVTAAPGVDVAMPAFADALGRYAIVDFRPVQRTDADGSFQSQRYTLDAPFSGRQRIPRLRMTFTDRRDDVPKEYEILTDEIPFEVRSVLPSSDFAAVLDPLRGELDLPMPLRWLWFALGAILVVGVGYVGYRRWSAQRAIEFVELAHERALRRLDVLERTGLPDAPSVDRWYVELSDIVRRYIEERFDLRAPELTTEEFLTVAENSVDLGERQTLLKAFLERCDAVKFARYSPEQAESRDAIASARRFLEETAVAETPAGESRNADDAVGATS